MPLSLNTCEIHSASRNTMMPLTKLSARVLRTRRSSR